jgi:hypothetical protein
LRIRSKQGHPSSEEQGNTIRLERQDKGIRKDVLEKGLMAKQMEHRLLFLQLSFIFFVLKQQTTLLSKLLG